MKQFVHKKIFITGGHFTPALAVMEKLSDYGCQMWYVTRKYAQEEDKAVSVEYQMMKNYHEKIKLLVITTGKIQRYINLKSIISLFKIPVGLIQSFYWISRYHPDLVLSFGGYVAFPLVLCAKIFRIPVITHEQTRSIGLANLLIGKIADRICLTWPETKGTILRKKTVVTGLPLRSSIFTTDKRYSDIKIDKQLIYITGGSLGSHSLNSLFAPILENLLKDFSIIQQCGETKKFNDYSHSLKFKKSLSKELSLRYLPLTYVDQKHLAWVYNRASLAIGRSGANTVYELAALKIPSIFIPLPWSANNEQMLNAQFFVENGAGIILKQKGLTSEFLYQEIIKFAGNLKQFKNRATFLSKKISLEGVNNLVRQLEDFL